MALSIPRVQHYLKNFKIEKMFVEELGWDRHSGKIQINVDGKSHTLTALAQKRGVQIFQCLPDNGNDIPDYATRRKIEKQVTKSAYEHLIIFIDASETIQIWQWVSRQPGLRAAYREHHYLPASHSGESLIQKLTSITFSLSDEEGLDITAVAFKLRDAFDRDKVTKKFYDHFKKQHATFLDFIKGITDKGDREWYASLMLNRLMFIYFIQKKGFLDGDPEYLKNRLDMVQRQRGKGKFLSFYRYFLIRLFHEGFSQQQQRKKDLEDLLGEVPYLNGGLFELHALEQNYPKIDIPDEAFENLFTFFNQYEWHLDNRPLSSDKEINPDVLGYIFEKYINQKQMGAYYTKEDITEYISKNTVIPYLFNAARKKCAVAFQPDASLWRLLKNDSLRYIYPAVTKGVIDTNGDVIPLPGEIAKGVEDVAKREGWNAPADAEYALPTETWREHVARRQRCLDLIDQLKKGKTCQINNLITNNLDIRQFAEDAITECEGPELLRAFYQAISMVTVLDPTCGSGAFLFAALNILEPLYDACLDRMQGFVDDLARSEKRHRPEKFSDFRRTLKEIDRHPNRRFFILKSIVVNNLYGVDIMEEAVEICKLRLFLKLVAQVDKVKQLEPLPDIDFNIRAGNTLVGFVTRDEVRQAAQLKPAGEHQQGKLPFAETQDEVQLIEEDAEDAERAFKRFHEMQTKYEMDAQDFKDAKDDLRERLKSLSGKLDQYLAKEYGVNLKKKNVFADWRSSHLPFHWFVEFYRIMSQGGFDVIIGNPPYLEMRQIDYSPCNLKTQEGGAIHAMCIERSLLCLQKKGAISMIVPLALVSTQRMTIVQQLLERNRAVCYANYAWRPGKLFDTVNRALTIFIAGASNNQMVFSTNYQKWNASTREFLMWNIGYTEIPSDRPAFWAPKLGNEIEKSILMKLTGIQSNLSNFMANNSENLVYYRTDGGLYWKVFTDFPPAFKINGRMGHSSRETKFALIKKDWAYPAISALSSNIFWWWYTITSNLRHLNPSDLKGFPITEIILNDKKLIHLGEKYLEDIKRNSTMLVRKQRQTGHTETQSFKVQGSKPIIDEIDRELCKHYRLNNTEIDFITNYDIKYRMGL